MRIGTRSDRPYPVQAVEKDTGGITPQFHGAREKVARLVDLTGVVRDDAVVKTFLGLTLPLREGATSPFDVGTGAIVMTVEENDTRPNADRALILSAEIMIES